MSTKAERIEPLKGGALLANNLVAFVFLMGAGIGLFIIPIIGWVLGPVCIIWAFQQLFQKPKPTWKGQCPYCQTEQFVPDGQGVAQCLACKNRFINRDEQFSKIDK
jgi:hypothetical protein